MPTFSIEAEGAATPMNFDNLLKALEDASGIGSGPKIAPKNMVVGAQQLKNWETSPGFYSLLQHVYLQPTLELNIRLLALIQLKNGIDSHWRKTSPNALSKEEKDHIRNLALEAGVNELNLKCAKLNGIILSKIARYEFPTEWPTLFTEFIDKLRQAASADNAQVLMNTLLVLLPIVKELSTARLTRMRNSLLKVTPKVVRVIGPIFYDRVERWTTNLVNEHEKWPTDNPALYVLWQSELGLKVLRRLIIAGYDHPNREKDVKEFWTFTRSQFSHLSPKAADLHLEHQTTNMFIRYLRQLAKFHVDMARTHPAAFVLFPHIADLLNTYMNLIIALGDRYGTSNGPRTAKIGTDGDAEEDEKPILEFLALKGLLIFRACLKMAFNPAQTFKYQHAEDKEERKVAVELIKTTILTDQFVRQIMEILVTKFFVFHEEELRNWEAEPEEWEKREEEIADSWEFSVRSCSEKLFLDLVINYKHLLVPGLLEAFQQYCRAENRDVMLKESIYSAIGLAAPCLEDSLDFNVFLKSTLLEEMQVERTRYNLLRRRIAILLGQWVPIKPADLDRKTIYAIFQNLLDTSNWLNDQVVRVTAGRQLRNVLDPFEFQYEDFEPYADSLLSSLMGLISEAELPETKMAILETVRVAVVKLERRLLPYADTLISLLPPLWEQSQDQHLMKQAILAMITAIITALGPDSLKYHFLIIPLIRNSLELELENLSYLLEDALDLMLAVLQQTPTEMAAPDLLSLSESIIPILKLGTDSLRQALEICDSFVLLSPKTMLSPVITTKMLPLMSALLPTSSSTTQSRNQMAQISVVLESYVQSVSLSSSRAAYTSFAQTFVSSGLLTKILAALLESYTYLMDPRPSYKTPAVSGITETDFYTVLARFAFDFPDLFVEAINAAAPAPIEGVSQQTAINWLIPAWLMHWDSIGDVTRKKLTALALTSLLGSTSPDGFAPPHIMKEQLQSLLHIWTDIVIELGEESAEKGGDYLAIWNNGLQQKNTDGVEGEWIETAEEKRKRERSKRDPVFMVNIRQFLLDRVQKLVANAGGAQRFQEEWLSTVDDAIIRGFGGLNLL